MWMAPGEIFCAGNVGFCWVFRGEMYLNLNRSEKNRKKPVETEEIWLTKRLERMKVNCGTVLRTRMNTGDFGRVTIEGDGRKAHA